MANQIKDTNARNYDPALMTGFGVTTNDIEAYFKNAVLGPTGIGVLGGASKYSVGLASGYAMLAGTATVITNTGTTLATGNTGAVTTETGTGFPPTFTTGSDLGTTGAAAAAANVASLYTTLNALPGIDISGNAAAIDAWNPAGAGLGVFVPGVYTTASSLGMTASKTITLSGAGDYIFVSTGGHIVFGANDIILLTNGATAGRVYWVAATYITSGATDTLVGNFINTGANAITIGSTNVIEGRLLTSANLAIDGTATTMKLPTAGSGSASAATTVAFGVRTQDNLGVSVAPVTLPALTTALQPDGVTIAGNLAIDKCRTYTYLAKVAPLTGVVTLSVVASNDFSKSRPVNVTTDVNLGDGSFAVVGYLYVKNESSAIFVPGTTVLNTTGITSSFGDGFGFMSYNAIS